MKTKLKYLLIVPAVTVSLIGCGDNDSPERSEPSAMPMAYQVTFTNLTNNQPMSPVAAIIHSSNYSAWQIGQPASAGLEVLAEGGDNSGFITEATESDAVYDAQSGNGLVMPSGNDVVTLAATETDEDMWLSFATMLVNTNDAFSGTANYPIHSLTVDEVVSFTAGTWDAGTEANSETAGTIPGPADGGEGYNSTRDDVDRVSGHPGVVSVDGGLSNSVLTEADRFNSPTVKVEIMRIR